MDMPAPPARRLAADQGRWLDPESDDWWTPQEAEDGMTPIRAVWVPHDLVMAWHAGRLSRAQVLHQAQARAYPPAAPPPPSTG